MAESTTTKPVNLYQLGQEIGGNPPLRAVGPDENGTTVVRSDAVDQVVLDAKITAHIADPEIRSPEVQSATDVRRSRIEQVRQKARAIIADPANAPDWTPLERKVILAVVVLETLGDDD